MDLGCVVVVWVFVGWVVGGVGWLVWVWCWFMALGVCVWLGLVTGVVVTIGIWGVGFVGDWLVLIG